MKTKRFLWIGLLLSILPAALQAADFTAWGRQMEITFPGYSGEREALTNFPALIMFQDGTNGVDFTEFKPEGVDLRFSDHTRTNELNYEIEAWNDAGSNSWVWVQVPELTSNTVIHAFWDHPEATKPAYTTNGATWDNGYDAVWHLDSGGEDASANNRDAVNSGATPGEGIIAGAHSFWDTYLDTPTLPLNTSFTITMWIRPNTLYNYGDAFGYEGRMSLVTYSNGDIKFIVGDGSWGSPVTAANALADETWHYIAATYDGSHTRMLVDDTWYGPVANTINIGEIPVYIGGRRTRVYWFHGAIDEVRLSNAPRSDDWIWACRMNRISNETFAVQGPATAQSWPEVATLPPENITETSAKLNGYLSRTGGTATAVHFFWGTTDGGTNAAQWAEEAVLPAPQFIGLVSTNVTLVSGNEYYVRCAASNEAGLVWAPETEYFLSSPVTLTVSPATVGEAWETATFTLSRFASTTGMPITVNFTTNGTATPESDYTGLDSQSVVILAGESNATVSVTSILDAYPEGDETLVLSLTEGLYAIGSPAQATLTLTNTAVALTNTWTGNGDGIDWFDAENWSTGVPVAGQNVALDIGASATLSNASPRLDSFNLGSYDTLTVEGWDSVIEADTITIAGTLTHAANTTNAPDPETGEWVPEHRIWLRGSNITVTANGKLNADYMGYRKNAGPGRPGNQYGGAGHARQGGRATTLGTPGGPAYGDPSAPWQPGSGAGTEGYAREGGGAIKIDAAGALTIDGTLTANGMTGAYPSGSGGSGGSIWLSCHTFHGTGTGLVRSNGGSRDGRGGNGAGGRIALHYNPTAQEALGEAAVPAVRFETSGGAPHTGSILPYMGTLYLSDSLFLTEVLENRRFWNCELIIPGFTSWTPASLTLDDCSIGLPAGFGLDVTGTLLLTNNARLSLRAAPVNNPVTESGATLATGGDLTLADHSWLAPYADETNGAPVAVSVDGDLSIDATSGIDADYKGYTRGYGPGHGVGSRIRYDGGGYGGIGGQGSAGSMSSSEYGQPDGPVQAGSGANSHNTSGRGGGAIILEVGGDALIDGTLTARGADGRYNGGAAGSGGGISIDCQTLQGSGLLCVDGGNGDNGGGAGGGGRIVVRYDTGLQATLPVPNLRFSAFAYAENMPREAEMGTLYLSNRQWFTENLAGQRFWHVRPVVPDLEQWAPASLILDNCVLSLPPGFNLDVPGDVILKNNARLYLKAAFTNDPAVGYGECLRVGGDLRMEANSWVYPYANPTNGAIVRMRVARDVVIDETSGINADGKGYFPKPGNNNGPGAGQSQYSGGGYGGAGGGTAPGAVYGQEALPIEPGSPAGDRSLYAGQGGGSIHLISGGNVSLNGTLTANGQQSPGGSGAGGSGGGIFVAGLRVHGQGNLQANGGNPSGTSGSGGGGRIAVWSGLPASLVEERLANLSARGLKDVDTAGMFEGTFSVAAGSGGATGDPGTATFYHAQIGTLFMLK